MFRGQITLFKNIPDAEQLQTTVGASVLPSAGQPLLLANQAGPGSLGARLALSLMTPQAGASRESLRAEPPPFTQRFNGNSQRMAGEHTHSRPHHGDAEYTFLHAGVRSVLERTVDLT